MKPFLACAGLVLAASVGVVIVLTGRAVRLAVLGALVGVLAGSAYVGFRWMAGVFGL